MTTGRGTSILILYGATLSTTRKHKYIYCTHSPTNSHASAHPLAPRRSTLKSTSLVWMSPPNSRSECLTRLLPTLVSGKSESSPPTNHLCTAQRAHTRMVAFRFVTLSTRAQQRSGRLMSTCHHELGTHFLRRYNDANQVWHKKRKALGVRYVCASVCVCVS